MMKAEVLEFCRQEQLFSPGDRVLCALSGGADSMALLWCLHSLQQELGICLCAAHFNHCLRQEASEADEAFVRNFCTDHGIELYVGRGDVRQYARQQGLGLEEAARKLRYDFLFSLEFDRLATAHHADDNAETVLLHLLRGSGLTGLCGIAPRRGKLVRPLLTVSKEQIEAYLLAEQIPWREDESNGEDFCLRNRLRHRVIPLLQEEQPCFARQIARQSRILRREEAYLEDRAAALLQEAETAEGAYACSVLGQADPVLRRRALRQLLRRLLPKDVSEAHTEAAEQLLFSQNPSAELCLPHGVYLRRSYGSIFAHTQHKSLPSPEEIPLQIPGLTLLWDGKRKIRCEITEKFEKKINTPFQFAVKYDMIAQSGLTVRSRREKDRIFLGSHSKSLKKLLIEKKIPRDARPWLPVFEQGGRILAVGGVATDPDYAPVTGEPAVIIHIE